MNTQQKISAFMQISKAIVEAIRAAGEWGAPAGNLYAALMTAGCNYEQFQGMMNGMVGAGILTKTGHIYRVGPNAAKLG